MLITYPLTQPDQPRWPTFGCFHSTGLQFDAYTVSSRGLTAINRGNCITRTVPRRRHADSRLLMLPNPHRYRWGAGGTGRPRCGARGRGPGRATSRRAEPHVGTASTAGVEGARGPGGHGRASRRGAERSEAAQPRGRPGHPAPGTPAAQQATKVGSRRPRAHRAARPDTTGGARNTSGVTSTSDNRSPRMRKTPPRSGGTGFTLPSRV